MYEQYLSPTSWEQYAGFWRRLAAAVVDTMMLVFVYFATGLLVVVFFVGAPADRWAALVHGSGPAIVGVAALLLAWAYSAGFECSSGQGTIGKATLGLAVCDERGARIGFGRASLRFVGKVLICLTLGIGFLPIAWDRRRRGLDDRVAHTIVVQRDPFGRTVVRGRHLE